MALRLLRTHHGFQDYPSSAGPRTTQTSPEPVHQRPSPAPTTSDAHAGCQPPLPNSRAFCVVSAMSFHNKLSPAAPNCGMSAAPCDVAVPVRSTTAVRHPADFKLITSRAAIASLSDGRQVPLGKPKGGHASEPSFVGLGDITCTSRLAPQDSGSFPGRGACAAAAARAFVSLASRKSRLTKLTLLYLVDIGEPSAELHSALSQRSKLLAR
jgi:hypothetical protein